MIAEDLRTFLLADATIAGLVDDRMAPGSLQQGTTYPAITYARRSGMADYGTEGVTGLEDDRWELNAWSTSYDEAHELAEAIDARLSGHRGDMGDTSVWGAFRISGPMDFEDPIAEGRKVYRVAQDYRLRRQGANT